MKTSSVCAPVFSVSLSCSTLSAACLNSLLPAVTAGDGGGGLEVGRVTEDAESDTLDWGSEDGKGNAQNKEGSRVKQGFTMRAAAINEGSSDDDCGGHKKSQCPSDTDKTKAEQVDEAMESKDAATQAAVTTCRSDRYRREMEKARV